MDGGVVAGPEFKLVAAAVWCLLYTCTVAELAANSLFVRIIFLSPGMAFYLASETISERCELLAAFLVAFEIIYRLTLARTKSFR